jgi:hypothetical protein
MTTHAGHDHENTKAARAKCRRENADPASPMAEKVRDRPIPDPKPKRSKRDNGQRVKKAVNTSLPHEFDADLDRPDRCYICRLTKFARVHTDGPTDLARRFGF